MSEKIKQAKPKEKLTFNMIWQKYGTFGILVILLVLLAIMRPGTFFSTATITQILSQSSVNILIAMGEFFAILIAGIDLSVGSVVALTGMVSAQMMVAGVNPLLAVLLGIIFGGFLGFINGLLINVTGLHHARYAIDFQRRNTYYLKLKRSFRFPEIIHKHYFLQSI